MTYSIRSLLGYVAAVSVALVASRVLTGLEMLYVVVPLGIIWALLIQKRRRRFVVYGALIGVLVGIVIAFQIPEYKYRHLPDVPLPVGRGQFDPNATQRPEIVRSAQKLSEPYGVTLGFFLGGICGLMSSHLIIRRGSAG
jgi:O-antigen ligase